MNIGQKRDMYIIGSILYILVNYLVYYTGFHLTLFAGVVTPSGINYASIALFILFIWFAGDSPVISDNGALIVDLLLLSVLSVAMLIVQDLLNINSNFLRWFVSAGISSTLLAIVFFTFVGLKTREKSKNSYHTNYYY